MRRRFGRAARGSAARSIRPRAGGRRWTAASIPPFQRDARLKGVPAAGAIYPVPESDIVIPEIPAHWPRAFGMDVAWNRTAVVWGALDRDTDVLYLYSEHYCGEAEPNVHADAIKARGSAAMSIRPRAGEIGTNLVLSSTWNHSMVQSLFSQNVIAVIWDFDKTLTPQYMQAPLFKRFGVDERTFWTEANGLADLYRRNGMYNMSADTLYLNHILTYVDEGIFNGLNNEMLFELGSEITFFPGLPEFFETLKNSVTSVPRFVTHGIVVEHYIVSTGIRQMIMGSRIAEFVEGAWGCEFAEVVGRPGYLETDVPPSEQPERRVIRSVGYAIDNTTKTRALFEINKGTNKYPNIQVNATISHQDRRVPFENMIYIADGPSDVPAFSIVNQYRGRTFAVYKPKSREHFKAVASLQENSRVQGIGEADYTEGSLTAMWLLNAVEQIAARIADDRDRLVRQRTGTVPTHILSDLPVDSKRSTILVSPTLAGPSTDDIGAKHAEESDAEGGRRRFYAACKLYLRSDFDKNKEVLVRWFDDHAEAFAEPGLAGFMDEFERSARGSVGAQHQRRSSRSDNSAGEKLLQFLDNLHAKYRMK